MKANSFAVVSALCGIVCGSSVFAEVDPNVAPEPPNVQAQLAAEIAKGKIVTEGLKNWQCPYVLVSHVKNDNIVWKCGDRPEAVFEVRGADGKVVPTAELKGFKLALGVYSSHTTTNLEFDLEKTGNPVTYTMTRTEPGVVSITARLRGTQLLNDGTRGTNWRDMTYVSGTVDKDGKAKRCDVTVLTRIGALFDPLAIKPGRPEPKYFGANWKKMLDADAKLPLKPKYLQRRGTNDAENVWTYAGVLDSNAGEVHFDWGVPKAAREGKKMPIRVFLQAYGTGFHFAETWISDQLTLGINCHSISNRAPGAYWSAAAKRLGAFGFSTNENAVVENCYHIGMLRRDVLALRWAMSQPEWDGKNFYVHGDSQGGFQTFALSGLVPQITRAWSMCPWYVDVGGSQQHWRPLAQPGPLHADPVYWITRSKAERIKFLFGICDSAGPADGLMALFNGIPDTCGFAEITIVQGRGHDAGEDSAKIHPTYVFTKKNGQMTGEYVVPGGRK